MGVNQETAQQALPPFPNETTGRRYRPVASDHPQPREVAMASAQSDSPRPPHNIGTSTWPTYRRRGRRFPVSTCLVPGLRVPGLVHADGTIWCGISGKRVPAGPGTGTLFQGSFSNTDDAVAVSASVMGLAHGALRRRLIDRLRREAGYLQRHLRAALTALTAEDMKRYVARCLDAESAASLLAARTSWLVGVMAIVDGPEDPLVPRRLRAHHGRRSHRARRAR
jgi:hypothetical protein